VSPTCSPLARPSPAPGTRHPWPARWPPRSRSPT
jgi:hypothetical protein